MTELVVAPLLPAVPESYRAKMTQSSTPGGLKARLGVLKTRAANWWEWGGVVVDASNDKAIQEFAKKAYVPRKPPVSSLLNYPNLNIGRLRGDSQWVYIRLHYHVSRAAQMLNRDWTWSGAVTLGNVLHDHQDILLWNAAADLYLAEELLAQSRFAHDKPGWLPNGLRALTVDGVDDLRGRVLYAIEAVSLMYREALQCERTIRVHTNPVVSPSMQEALDWFNAFATAVDELNTTQAGAKKEGRWKRTKRYLGY